MSFQDLTRIRSVIFYSNTGTRVTAQYYDSSIPEEKRKTFEDDIYKRASEDYGAYIMQQDEFIVVFRKFEDILIFVIGDLKSNELLLDEVLDTIINALQLVFKKVNSDSLIQQIDLLYLLLDETIEQGFIFEGDSEVVAARVLLKDDKAFAGKNPSKAGF